MSPVAALMVVLLAALLAGLLAALLAGLLTALLAALLALLLYLYGTRNYQYWARRGVQYVRPLPFIGNNASICLMQHSLTEASVCMYHTYPEEKVIGTFWASKPQLVIRDPELVRRVLTTDFTYFYPRGLNRHKKVIEPLLRNLFFADGDLWRLLRQRMTPAFTSSKLKAMFPLIVERAEKLQARAVAAATSGQVLDARELMARYTTDFIGACGFGLDTDSLSDEQSSFRKLGVKIFNIGPEGMLIAMLKEIFPELCKHLKYTYRVETDIIDLVTHMLELRNYKPSGRNDFIDLLLECKEKGTIVGESIETMKPDGTPEITTLELDDELIAAQVFVFFAAGFETSSSATSFTLHQLAYNKKAQIKVQEEIDRVLAKHGNKLNYDAVRELTYLNCCFKEAMRMFPPLGFLIRECAHQYTFPEINLTIDKGVAVVIPVQALQNDPKHFDSPEEFRPERFHPDKSDSINKFTYLPFGAGPRACIGERLGLLQSLAGLAAVLGSFSVQPAPASVPRPQVQPGAGIVQAIKGGLPLLFRKRTSWS